MTNTDTTRDAQPPKGPTRIEIYSDGSCIGNPGYGGYGAVLLRLDAADTIKDRTEISGPAQEITTNIRMEMTAVCAANERLGVVTEEPIFVYCDSNLIPNAMNDWVARWKANGWKKSDGKAPPNRDLWDRLEIAAEGRLVTWLWVRGHNGAEHNERADRMAYAAARRAETASAAR